MFSLSGRMIPNSYANMLIHIDNDIMCKNSWVTMAKHIKQTAGSPWQNKSNKQMLVQNYKTMTHRGQKWHFKKVTVNSCLGNVRSPEQSVRNIKTGTKHTKLKHFR